MKEGTSIKCPNCSEELTIEELIVTEDFHYCPDCNYEGWIGDFQIEKN